MQTGEILRIWYGGIADTVIDVKQSQRCQYSAFTRRFKPIEPVGDMELKKALRDAKKWLKSPKGSTLVNKSR